MSWIMSRKASRSQPFPKTRAQRGIASVGSEHDLAYHAALSEQVVGLSCLKKRESLRNKRLDLSLLKKVKKCDQILSEPCPFQPLKCLDAVGDHPPAARQKPAPSDVQPENCDCTITMTTTTTT